VVVEVDGLERIVRVDAVVGGHAGDGGAVLGLVLREAALEVGGLDDVVVQIAREDKVLVRHGCGSAAREDTNGGGSEVCTFTREDTPLLVNTRH
jgi:hypothetical protein